MQWPANEARIVLHFFENGLPVYACNGRLFLLKSVQFVFSLSCITPLQVLLANTCPCGSATSFFFVIVFIELCKYTLIEVVENIDYYYY